MQEPTDNNGPAAALGRGLGELLNQWARRRNEAEAARRQEGDR